MTVRYVMVWLEAVVIHFKDETEEDHKARREGNSFLIKSSDRNILIAMLEC